MKDDSGHKRLLVLLLVADFVYVLFHIVHKNTGLLPSSQFSLARDGGYAEFFQYAKEFWTGLLLIRLGWKQRDWLYWAASALFVYFLLDDSLKFHEQFGVYLANLLGFQPALGLRAVDWGELLVSAAFGLLFGAIFVLFYLLSTPVVRRNIFYLAIMAGGLAFFGVVVDMVEIGFGHSSLHPFLVIFEEGGEMLVMSLITWYVFELRHYPGQDVFVSLLSVRRKESE